MNRHESRVDYANQVQVTLWYRADHGAGCAVCQPLTLLVWERQDLTKMHGCTTENEKERRERGDLTRSAQRRNVRGKRSLPRFAAVLPHTRRLEK